MRTLLIIFAIVSLAATQSHSVCAQTLNELRSAVRKPASDAPPKKKHSRKRSDDCDSPSIGAGITYSFSGNDDDDDDDSSESLTGQLFLAAASTPFVVPRAMLGDDGKSGFYPDHPYDNDSCGIVFEEAAPGAHDSLLVFQSSYGTNFGDLDHGHGRLFGDTGSRLGLDTEVFYRREQLATGDDEIWHGDFNVTYRFAQNESWQFRAGLGVNWLSDRFDTDAGFNTTYGFEWFPQDPVVVSTLIDWGRLGESSVFHLRSTIGATHNGWGVFTGFDYLKIGKADIPAWINGVEFRF